MRADLSDLDYRYRAKRSAQSPAEYAAAIYGYRAPTSRATKMLRLLAAVLLVATLMALS